MLICLINASDTKNWRIINFDTYSVLHFPKYATSQSLVQFQALETQTEDGCEIQDVPALFWKTKTEN